VELVFFDTTSLYFEGQGGESIGQRGHTKDHRPDLKQMVVGMAVDVQGRPICCEMWPGNTADVTTLVPIVKRMGERFRLREITVVADRGMVSTATLDAFESSDPPVGYIVGVRMRRQKEVSISVLGSRKPWFESVPERSKAKDPAPLKIKEVSRRGAPLHSFFMLCAQRIFSTHTHARTALPGIEEAANNSSAMAATRLEEVFSPLQKEISAN
jgi:hypothetical protein